MLTRFYIRDFVKQKLLEGKWKNKQSRKFSRPSEKKSADAYTQEI